MICVDDYVRVRLSLHNDSNYMIRTARRVTNVRMSDSGQLLISLFLPDVGFTLEFDCDEVVKLTVQETVALKLAGT
jgi:hypothetical protein